MNDKQMHDLLENTQTIAVIGYSDNPARTSYQIGAFLRRVGYKVYAVNPTIAEADGQPVYATLADVPAKIDMVNVFRRSEYLPEIVSEAIAVGAKSVWAQLGVEHRDALDIAHAAHLPLVMDRCIKVEYMRLDVQRLEES